MTNVSDEMNSKAGDEEPGESWLAFLSSVDVLMEESWLVQAPQHQGGEDGWGCRGCDNIFFIRTVRPLRYVSISISDIEVTGGLKDVEDTHSSFAEILSKILPDSSLSVTCASTLAIRPRFSFSHLYSSSLALQTDIRWTFSTKKVDVLT